jgi:FkbM family methyltransferase
MAGWGSGEGLIVRGVLSDWWHSLGRRWGPRLIAALPAGAWRWVGPWLARTHAPGWAPGWKFGTADAESSTLGLVRLALWHHFKAHQVEAPFVIRWYDGLRVTMYLGNDLSLCLFVGGMYEPNEFMFLSRVLQPGMSFIDVGANDGLYTLFAARRVGATGHVIAVEPSRRELARLQRNLSLNHLENVVVVAAAAGDRDGHADLRIAGFGHEGQNTLGGFAYAIDGAGFESVRVARLDQIVEDQALSGVDVVKIDAEGAELGVLQGSERILSKWRPVILFEVVEAALRQQGARRQDVVELLEQHGYGFWMFGSSGVPEPISAVDVEGVNVIAVHRESDVMERLGLPGSRRRV